MINHVLILLNSRFDVGTFNFSCYRFDSFRCSILQKGTKSDKTALFLVIKKRPNVFKP